MISLETRPVGTSPFRHARWSSRVTSAGLMLSIVALLLVQLVPLSNRNPLTDTLSSYVYVEDGWLFPAGLIALAIGIIGLMISVAGRRFSGARILTALLGTAGMGALTAALCPAARSGGKSVGEVHRYSSIALMVAVPVAALVLVRPGLHMVIADGQRTLIGVLVITAVLSGGLFLVGQLVKPGADSDPAATSLAGGISQRVLVTAVFALLMVMFRVLGTSSRVSASIAGGRTVG